MTGRPDTQNLKSSAGRTEEAAVHRRAKRTDATITSRAGEADRPAYFRPNIGPVCLLLSMKEVVRAGCSARTHRSEFWCLWDLPDVSSYTAPSHWFQQHDKKESDELRARVGSGQHISSTAWSAQSLTGRSEWRPCTLCPSVSNQSTLPSFLPLPLLVFMLEIAALDTLVLSPPL